MSIPISHGDVYSGQPADDQTQASSDMLIKTAWLQNPTTSRTGCGNRKLKLQNIYEATRKFKKWTFVK